jgi:molybdopterin converting factor small subunit
MQITAKFFGLYMQITGVGNLAVTLPEGATVALLIDLLNEKYEKLAIDIQRTVVLVNRIKAEAATILHDGDEAFILHLMSGG